VLQFEWRTNAATLAYRDILVKAPSEFGFQLFLVKRQHMNDEFMEMA
jgi:hypothetical protein